MKKILIIIIVLLSASCEKNCDDQRDAIIAEYYEYMEQAAGNEEQVRAIEREMHRKIAEVCD